MNQTAEPITVQMPELYARQRAAFFNDARYSVCEASTKAGKTIGAIVWQASQVMRDQAGRNHWWVAPVYPQAAIAYRRAKAMFRGLHEHNDSDLRLTFRNGAAWWFKTGEKPDNLYGEDVFSAVVDEFTRCREEAWHAIRSTLTATRGPVRLIGNVKGRGNWGYRLARKAEAGEPDMAYHRIVAQDAINAGVLDADEIEDARAQLPEQVFRELYECVPSDDGGNPFGIAAIAACVGDLSTADPVAFGVDLAKSHDWTVVCGLDAEGRVCRLERWQGPWGETRTRILAEVNGWPALIDSTGVGDPIVEDLQRVRPNMVGFKFSSQSKQQIMEGLAVAIQRGEVRYPGDWLKNELDAFEYEYTRTGVRYCLDPSTRVLTADLRWVSIGSVATGDSLLAFDEHPQGRKNRHWKYSVVTEASTVDLPCYRLDLDDGTEVIASENHRWLVDTGPGGLKWRATGQLRASHATSKSLRFSPSRLVRVLMPWVTNQSYDAGYLAGVLDGEGHLSQRERSDRDGQHSLRVGFAQRDNPLASRARISMTNLGFKWSECLGGGTHKDVTNFGITGRQQEVLRVLGEVRPVRLLESFDADKMGSIYKMTTPKVLRKTFIGTRVVSAISTTSKTFIAEGLLSHNCAPQGLHDDGVCALAMAIKCYTDRTRHALDAHMFGAGGDKTRRDDDLLTEDPNIWS
jgi:hypothetical protein